MDWLTQWRFLVLFLALILFVVVYPLLEDYVTTRWLYDVLFTGVFLGALFAIFKQRRLRLVACLLGIPTLLGLWTDYVVPGLPRLPLAFVLHLGGALFFGLTVVTILMSIYKDKTVTADSIFGAFCGYVLTGLAFGHVFALLETSVPGSFHSTTGALLDDPERRHFLLVYYSFITMTTVGYGDITPATGPARSFAVIEAICGQFYIAVLVADLIGKRVAQALSDQ